MKIATLFFNRAETQRTFRDALRARMYTAGYEPHQVTDMLRLWFTSNWRMAVVSGTADAERAADVAHEVRGVVCKLKDA